MNAGPHTTHKPHMHSGGAHKTAFVPKPVTRSSSLPLCRGLDSAGGHASFTNTLSFTPTHMYMQVQHLMRTPTCTSCVERGRSSPPPSATSPCPSFHRALRTLTTMHLIGEVPAVIDSVADDAPGPSRDTAPVLAPEFPCLARTPARRGRRDFRWPWRC